jgi:hypothetical protein
MEARFGRNFGRVRIHADTTAADTALAAGASALTAGNHIVFGKGRFAPSTVDGQRLLVHELAHVVQQTESIGHPLSPAGAEAEAVRVSAHSASSGVAGVRGSVGPGVQRDELTEDEIQTLIAEKEAAAATTEMTPEQQGAVQAELNVLGKAAGEAKSKRTEWIHTFTRQAAKRTERGTPGPDVPAKRASAPFAQELVPMSHPPPGNEQRFPTDWRHFRNDHVVATFASELSLSYADRTAREEAEVRYQAMTKAARLQTRAKPEIAAVRTEIQAMWLKTLDEDFNDTMTAVVSEYSKQWDDHARTSLESRLKHERSNVDMTLKRLSGTESSRRMRQPSGGSRPTATLSTSQVEAPAEIARQRALLEVLDQRLAWLALARQARRGIRVKPRGMKTVVVGEEGDANAGADATIDAIVAEEAAKERLWLANEIERYVHAWMVERREELDFYTVKQPGVSPLPRSFKPPRDVPEEERLPLPGAETKDPPVAPELAGFTKQLMSALKRADSNFAFSPSNYPGHGGGAWAGKGYSVDLTLTGKSYRLDERGFYEHRAAVAFLKTLADVAKNSGVTWWRVLYDDFAVAEEVNRYTGFRNVTNTANVAHGLNWHGPDPMKLHFHLDIAPATSFPREDLPMSR